MPLKMYLYILFGWLFPIVFLYHAFKKSDLYVCISGMEYTFFIVLVTLISRLK